MKTKNFLEKFEADKRYVFSALKYLEYFGAEHDKETFSGIKKFDGCIVTYIGKPDMALVDNGKESAYVMPFACREILFSVIVK